MLRVMSENWAFVRANARWLGSCFLLLLFSSFGQTFFIGLSGADLRRQFGLSGGEFGSLYMIATLISAATLPLLGRTLDVMPVWKVVRFSIAGLAAGALLLALAPNIILLGAALTLLRLFGQGMLTEIAFTAAGRWFVASRGRAMALIAPGLQLGFAILPLGFVLAHEMGGWRAPWTFSAALIALVGGPIIIYLMRFERTPKAKSSTKHDSGRARDWTQGEVIRDPILYLLLAGTLAPPFIGTVIFFHQSYLIELRGYDPVLFASAFPIMAVTTVAFGLFCGHLIDRHGALRLLPFFLLPLCAASAVIAWSASGWALFAFMLLMGVSSGFAQTLLGALWPEVYGTAHLGSIRAITVSAMVLSTAIGPAVTGQLMDRGVLLTEQMGWMAVWCLLASICLAVAARRIARRNSQGSVMVRHGGEQLTRE